MMKAASDRVLGPTAGSETKPSDPDSEQRQGRWQGHRSSPNDADIVKVIEARRLKEAELQGRQ